MKIFIPDKIEYMPQKKIYLARAGAIYSKVLDNEKLMGIANKIYLHALELVKPCVYWDVFSREQLSELDIPNRYKDYKEFLIFLSTIGFEIDEEIERLSKNSTLEAALLDAWGSEAIEVLNDNFEKYFKKEYGMNLTMRFSPGYEDLDIRRNKSYVRLLNLEDKITVLESGLIIPRKTTTCIAGIIK
ncbi:methionine synthase [Fervidobacterium sp.]